MHILFVAPSFPGRVSEYLVLPSLELCIMSTILKSRGHTVSLYDMKILQHRAEDAQFFFANEAGLPDYILIDDSPEVHCTTRQLLPLIRKTLPNSLIALRGEIATFAPEATLMRNPEVDFLLLGDDDYSLINIIENHTEQGFVQYGNIENIAYREADIVHVVRAKSRQYKLDDLPYPDRQLYDISAYKRRDSETIVRSSRGCPGCCDFCIKTKMEQFGVFSVRRFVDEIEELLRFGFESFFFSDDTFAFSDKRLEEFANELDRRNLTIKFTSNIRISDINEYKISTLKRLGAYRVFVGIETVNANTSKGIKKNLNQQIIRDKIAILKKYGMEFHASFILGAPGDTEDDLLQTIDFVREIKPTIVTFNMLKVYPGLPYYSDPESYGVIMPDKYWYESDTWTHSCIMGTKQLPPAIIEQWSRKMLFEFIL